MADDLRNTIPSLLAKVDGRLMVRSARALHASDRRTCFRRYAQTVETLTDAYRQAGAGADVEQLSCRPFDGSGQWILPETFVTGKVRVEMTAPRCACIADADRNPCHIVMGGAATPPQGVEGPLVAVNDSATLASMADGALSGRIVLFRGSPRGVLRDLARTGAAAVLGVDPVARSPVAVRWLKLGFGGLALGDADCRPVAVSLSARQADRLRRLMDRGPAVRVRVRVDRQPTAPEHPLTVAWLPGADPALGEVWGVGHVMEPGALDNASGAAVFVEIARLISRGVAAGILPPPRRTIRFLHGFECFGPFQYLTQRHDPALPLLGGVVLDAVGSIPAVSGGHLGWYDSVPGSTPIVDRLGAAYLRETLRLRNPGYRLTSHPFAPSSENLLGDPAYGFPCPWLSTCYRRNGDVYDAYHSSADTLALLDPQGLGVTAVAMATLLADLAAMDTRRLLSVVQTEMRRGEAHCRRADPVTARHIADSLHTSLDWGARQGLAVDPAAGRRLDAWRARVALIAPPRQPGPDEDCRVFRRCRPLTPHDANLPPDQREALRQSGIPGHALYWIDGRRTVSEVAERLTVALRQPVAVAAVGALLDRMQAIGFLDA